MLNWISILLMGFVNFVAPPLLLATALVRYPAAGGGATKPSDADADDAAASCGGAAAAAAGAAGGGGGDDDEGYSPYSYRPPPTPPAATGGGSGALPSPTSPVGLPPAAAAGHGTLGVNDSVAELLPPNWRKAPLMSACPEWVARRCVSPRLFALLCGRIMLVVVVVAIISKVFDEIVDGLQPDEPIPGPDDDDDGPAFPEPEPEPAAAAAVLVRRALQGIA